MPLSRGFYTPKNASQIDAGKSDATVYVDGLIAIGFHGRAQTPDWFIQFKSEEDRDLHIRQFIESRIAHKELISERKAAREKAHTLKIGDILVSSWGYDQTNVDFYQVIKTTSRTVTIQSIAQAVENSELTYDGVVAARDSFYGKPMQKVVDGASNSVRIESFAYAHPWNGEAVYQTNPLFGH
tara:strand:+ start:387 stop:935 length:549 start_codon:yes stop_codon:yes gene_type:complete